VTKLPYSCLITVVSAAFPDVLFSFLQCFFCFNGYIICEILLQRLVCRPVSTLSNVSQLKWLLHTRQQTLMSLTSRSLNLLLHSTTSQAQVLSVTAACCVNVKVVLLCIKLVSVHRI